jgi:hypothetical protein
VNCSKGIVTDSEMMGDLGGGGGEIKAKLYLCLIN